MLKNREIFGFLDFFVYLCSTMIKNEVMTQEEKQLLMADLCARLPYFLRVNIRGEVRVLDSWADDDGNYFNFLSDGDECNFGEGFTLEEIKPYLRPLSSMTEEEKHKLLKFGAITRLENGEIIDVSCVGFERHTDVQDYLNACHFDYRGLIEKGLAIAVTEENNPYKE